MSFEKVGINYNTIAIIGPQSSGKSTLLNFLFDTKFEVMNSTIRRGQTTKGVWIAANELNKVLIIDCEGTDSKSRNDHDRGKFEHSSSLFALAMSDILIINMWTSDVGRYTASNYGVLKIVFEMNLKLFEQKTAKKIIIFLRDFDPTRNKRDKIEELILEDIKRIWKEIKIPEEYAGKGPEHFFSFEFITLPHLIYKEKDFMDEIQNLRKRLKKDDKDYLFNNLSSIKNVPADGLKQYVTQIWNDILNDKDLDIPSQREMLANYRCNEIKNKILFSYEDEFQKIYKLTSEKNVEEFKDLCIKLDKNISDEYEKQGCNYENSVYKNIFTQLKEQISQKLYKCFLNQIKRLIPLVQKWMRQDLSKKLLKLDENKDDNYLLVSEKLRKKHLSLFIQKLNSKKAFDSWKVGEKEYSNLFDEIIDEQKKKALNKIKNYHIEILKQKCEELFNKALDNFTKEKNFWKGLNEKYIDDFNIIIFEIRKNLRDRFNCQNDEIKEILFSLQDKIYTDAKKSISKNLRDLSTKIVEQFKKKFWYEENSDYQKVKNWERYEENQIDKLFKDLRSEYLPLFEQLKFFLLIKDIISLINFDKMENWDSNQSGKYVEIALNNMKEKEVLLKPGDILTLKKKFELGISEILVEAKRRKEGFQINMPAWFYVLLIFFGYDDLFRLIRTWYILPILLCGGGYFALIKLGYDWIIKDSYFVFEEKVNKLYKGISRFIGNKIREIKLKYNIKF